MIKVLIVDDSALVRQTFKTILESDSEIKVIGTANDPFIAVQKIQKEKPDVITLDVVMPKMDGLTFLKKIMRQAPMPVIVISNQTSKGADIALKALEYGATNILVKPNISSEQLLNEAKVNLIDSVKSAFYAGKKSKRVSNEISSNSFKDTSPKNVNPNTIIAIGASTGGTDAIKQFLDGLPPSMPPILIVQHMPEKFTASFAKRLNEICRLHVKEAENGEKIEANTVYIAPGNFHMSLIASANNKYIQIKDGELVNRHRPSVNVLFNSIAENIGKNAVGVILTGMGDDGATGLKKMRINGAYTVAQDEESSVVFGMPFRAIEQNAAKDVLPLSDIPNSICKYLNKK